MILYLVLTYFLAFKFDEIAASCEMDLATLDYGDGRGSSLFNIVIVIEASVLWRLISI
jgi:hypothetical protein